MRRAPQLFLALLALFVLVSSASAVAANCAAGRAKFDTICRGCHSPDEKKGKSTADIFNALAFQSAMEGLFPDFVNATDVENLAEYLFLFPAACPASAPNVSAAPTAASFGNVNVGETSAGRTITLTNSGASNATGLTYSASNAAEFPVTKTCGSTLGFAAGSNTCTITISYVPSASGADSATYRITGANNVAVTISLDGTGVAASPPAETAIEYYHAAFDHYFVTAIADEITKLDNGTFVGWARTGTPFKVYPAAARRARAVCRFFSTAFGPEELALLYAPTRRSARR